MRPLTVTGNPAWPHFSLNFRVFSKQRQQNTDCGAVPTHLKSVLFAKIVHS